MVGKVLGIKDLEQFSSRRSSVYVDPECDKFFELPLFIAASSNDITTKCQCFQFSPGKEPALRSYTEIQQLLQQGKKRDVKNILRENSWPINSPIRAQLWPMLCGQHQTKQQMLDGFYWEMVHQVFGTTELSEKPIMLPAFVDATHCLPYHLTSTGRAVADRIVNVLGYDCPDITYSPLFTLWSWLPVRITMYQPVLLYTTEEHGCSLTTFYVRVEQHEPTLLMIKTCNNEVFGAYCSSRWFERNVKDDKGQRQAYFGTGETFLFSLYPERAKYPWVGIEGDKDLGHSSELFMAADSKMITIGGGEGQAIWMDENIRFGKTDSCKTFNNPPLCPSGDFEIRVLEVYGFVGI
ncbi:GD21669 [Drosophila simulans]|uniref:GD21669 n=1 Tax=Drosophila simulans TaxID=7240 RepID=B4Q3W5_DROSI|nr:GD21669 [Drosophila simulans]